MSNLTEEKKQAEAGTCSTTAKTCSTEGKVEKHEEAKASQCSEAKVHPEGTRLAEKKEGCCGL